MKTNAEIEEYFIKLVKERPLFYGKLIAGAFTGENELYSYEAQYFPSSKYAKKLDMVQIDNMMFYKNSIYLVFRSSLDEFYFADAKTDAESNPKYLDQEIDFMLDILCKYDVAINNSPISYKRANLLTYSRIFKKAYEKRSNEDKLLIQLKYPELIILEEDMGNSKEELSKICSESFTKEQFAKLKELILKGEIA